MVIIGNNGREWCEMDRASVLSLFYYIRNNNENKMHARSKMATGSHIMRKIAVRGAMQPSVTVTSYYRNAHLKTLNVKVILHYLLFIYLCDITEWRHQQQQLHEFMASHQKFGKIEDQHSISNSTNSSPAAGSREDSHKISLTQSSSPWTRTKGNILTGPITAGYPVSPSPAKS